MAEGDSFRAKKTSELMVSRFIVWSTVAVGIALPSAYFLMQEREMLVEVKLPAGLSPIATSGERSFQTHCEICHGVSGRGSENGPPLVHRIYAPDHHTDTVFILAMQLGVRGHHWGNRNMPALPELDVPTIQNIMAYVREVQRANGIR
jgi:cytochrome c